MKNGTKCCVEPCNNKAFYPSSGLCKQCYSGMYYWTRPKNRKTPTDILNYQRKLVVRASRMRMLQPTVSPIRVREKVRA